MKHKRVVIAHDVFVEFGGAERVLLSLLKIFPQADVIVPIVNAEGLKILRTVTSGKISDCWLNHIPFFSPASILLKPFFYLFWESLELNEYDLVITSSHTFSSKSIITGPQTKHVSYIHTPPKYLYTEYQDVKVLKNKLLKFVFLPLLSWLRMKDFLAGQRPDVLIANSTVVQKRIQKYYRRGSTIIHPPVLLPSDRLKGKKEYYLCFSRLTKQKGIDLVVKTLKELDLPLLVVGQGSEEEELRKLSGSKTQFKGFVSDKELPNLFAKAKALINCAKDEDFGLVNAEALSFGVPIIAYNSGAANEIVDSKVGVLFDEYSVKGLGSAIKKFNQKDFSADVCRKKATLFSEQMFQEKVKKILEYEI